MLASWLVTFSGPNIYQEMSRWRWWKHRYCDVIDYVKNCPQCAIATRVGKKQLPPLCPIPVQYPFQIIGVDIMHGTAFNY